MPAAIDADGRPRSLRSESAGLHPLSAPPSPLTQPTPAVTKRYEAQKHLQVTSTGVWGESEGVLATTCLF